MEVQSPTSTPEVKPDFGNRVPRDPETLKLCRGCNRHIYKSSEHCDFCGEEVAKTDAIYEEGMRKAQLALKRMEEIMTKHAIMLDK